MLTNTCQCAQTQTAYTCCANIQECTHTLTRTHTCTRKYIHTLTLTKIHMLTQTHHAADSCQCTKLSPPSTENKELCPPPSPHLAQLPHVPGALTDVAVSRSVAAASPVPASVGRVCRTVSTLQSNNESCHTKVFDVCLKVQETASQFQCVTHTKTIHTLWQCKTANDRVKLHWQCSTASDSTKLQVTVQNCKWLCETALTLWHCKWQY